MVHAPIRVVVTQMRATILRVAVVRMALVNIPDVYSQQPVISMNLRHVMTEVVYSLAVLTSMPATMTKTQFAPAIVFSQPIFSIAPGIV
jgi:hypothetical protein